MEDMEDMEVFHLPVEEVYMPVSVAMDVRQRNLHAHGQWLAAYWEALRERRRFTYLCFTPLDCGPRQKVLPLNFH